VSSLSFGPIVLGGNVFGWTVGPEDGFAVLDAFLDGGGRSIDTADSYTQFVPGNVGGESETRSGTGWSPAAAVTELRFTPRSSASATGRA
jgi:aryl-alcohol dehydrogenase-like predicted oxidoreductase